AEFAPGAVGGRLRSFRGEAAFLAALLEVTDPEQPRACFTSGHGERPLASDPGGDLARVVSTLAGDGLEARDLPALAPIPPGCAAVAIVGPRRPFAAADARALEDWLGRGGRLLVAVDPERDGATFRPTGLEALLERHGVRLRDGIVVDPNAEIGAPLA